MRVSNVLREGRLTTQDTSITTPEGKCHPLEMKNFWTSKNLTEGGKRQAVEKEICPSYQRWVRFCVYNEPCNWQGKGRWGHDRKLVRAHPMRSTMAMCLIRKVQINHKQTLPHASEWLTVK